MQQLNRCCFQSEPKKGDASRRFTPITRNGVVSRMCAGFEAEIGITKY